LTTGIGLQVGLAYIHHDELERRTEDKESESERKTPYDGIYY